MLQRYAILATAWLGFFQWALPTRCVSQEARLTPAAPGAKVDPVVVRVSGEPVTEKQVLDSINQLAMQLAAQNQASPEQIQQKDTVFFREALDTLVGTILLKNEARENNLIADKAKVDEAMQATKARFGDDAKFQQALQQQGVQEADVRRSIETDLLCQQMIERIAKSLPLPSDAEIQKYYDANPKSFLASEQRHLAVISLLVEKSSSPEAKTAIRKRLESIRADVESKKITFAQAAIKESDDKANSAKGGDIGFVRRGMMMKLLEDAAFTTPAGSLTPILESEIGYHLLEVIEVKPAGIVPLDSAKPKIKDFLERQAKQEATKKHLEELKSKAKIEILMSDEEWNKRHATK